MADEPRRSGRATKGQHTKNADEPEAVETPPPKSKSKGKRAKNAQTEQAEEGGSGDTVRCLCGQNDGDDDDRPFICCDNCDAWQHKACMGLPDNYNPKAYFCEQCKPENHVNTVEALNAGEKPNVVAARHRKGPRTTHQKKAGRKSQGARQSTGGEVLQAPLQADPVQQSTAPPVLSEQNKRKQVAEDSAQPSKLRKGSSQVIDASAPTTSKANAGATPSIDSLTLVGSLDELHDPHRKKAASTLKIKIMPLIKSHVSSGAFRIPDGDTADSLSERLALRLEYSMFMNHCSPKSEKMTDAYRTQTQIIVANVPKNAKLAFQFIDGQITPDALSTMSASDMATDEQKQRDAKMKEENEKQAILVKEEGIRIRRTHKGEELVEDSGDQFASESITPAAVSRRMLSHDEGDPASAGSDAASAGFDARRPPPITTDAGNRPASVDQKSPPDVRRTPSNFNMDNVWSSVHSPAGGQVRPMQQPPRRSSGPGPMSPQAPDADIDRLLDNEEGDDAPYSPVETSGDPSLVWRGSVDMPVPESRSIGRFTSRAYYVAGADLSGREHCAALFPQDIVLAGRIAADAADKYLSSLSAARSTDVSVFELIRASNEENERAEFDRLFHYLHSRERYGVVSEKSHRANVRDVYLVPLDEGAGKTPEFLNRLDQNIIESPRTRRMLVVVFVIRWKSPAGSSQPTPATPSAPIGSAVTPTVRSSHELGSGAMKPSQSPMPEPHIAIKPGSAQQPPYIKQSPQPPQQYPQQYPQQQQYPPVFPSNPYGPPPPQAYASLPQHTQPYSQGQQYPPHSSAPEQQDIQQILGHFYASPVARQIIEDPAQKQQLTKDLLEKMRKVFDKNPNAATDISVFSSMLHE